jgi:hypothetical protein
MFNVGTFFSHVESADVLVASALDRAMFHLPILSSSHAEIAPHLHPPHRLCDENGRSSVKIHSGKKIEQGKELWWWTWTFPMLSPSRVTIQAVLAPTLGPSAESSQHQPPRWTATILTAFHMSRVLGCFSNQ